MVGFSSRPARALLAFCIAVSSGLALGADPKLEAALADGGLQKINVKGIDLVYARPGAKLSTYGKVIVDPVKVSFAEPGSPSSAAARCHCPTRTRISSVPASRRSFTRSSFASFSAKSGYEVVTASGPDVLRVKPEVMNLYVTAPQSRAPSRAHLHHVGGADDAGRGTLGFHQRPGAGEGRRPQGGAALHGHEAEQRAENQTRRAPSPRDGPRPCALRWTGRTASAASSGGAARRGESSPGDRRVVLRRRIVRALGCQQAAAVDRWMSFDPAPDDHGRPDASLAPVSRGAPWRAACLPRRSPLRRSSAAARPWSCSSASGSSARCPRRRAAPPRWPRFAQVARHGGRLDRAPLGRQRPVDPPARACGRRTRKPTRPVLLYLHGARRDVGANVTASTTSATSASRCSPSTTAASATAPTSCRRSRARWRTRRPPGAGSPRATRDRDRYVFGYSLGGAVAVQLGAARVADERARAQGRDARVHLHLDEGHVPDPALGLAAARRR